jgi:Holliday junction resolvasome RuvABC endonuclease subunit
VGITREETMKFDSIVGVDLSKRSTGVVIRSKKGFTSFAKKAPKEISIPELDLRRMAKAIMTPIVPGTLVVLEDYVVRFGSTAWAIELAGVIKQRVLKKTGCVPLLVTPTALKKFTTGKGQGDKVVMAKAVLNKWKVEFDTTDETDAYMLSEIGALFLGWETQSINQAQLNTLIGIAKYNKIRLDKSLQHWCKSK